MSATRDMAAVMTGLRMRAVAHNRAHPAAAVKLGRLKKLWMAGYRTGKERGAEAAVTAHLRKLTSLSREILAKAEDSFSESDHPRDQRGRFARGGGQRRLYRDVATPQEHQQLAAENAGYRAQQTQVIPETRGTAFGPWAGGAAGLAAGAYMGATADMAPDRVARAVNEGMAWGAGRLGGAAASGAVSAAGAVRNLARSARGKSPVDMEAAAMRASEKVGGSVRSGARTALDLYSKLLVLPSRWTINHAKASADRQGLTGVARALRVGTGRVRGATIGMAIPGYFLAQGGWRAGETLGPMYDAAFPRHVQKSFGLADLRKIAARPESAAVLSKRIPGMARLAGYGNKAARAVASVFGRSKTPSQVKADALKDAVTGVFPRPSYRAVGLGAGMGAVGGGLMAGAGALGVRTYYRDKDGRFTSKDQAVIGGSAALGALAGAAGVAAFLRGKNRAISREMAERIRSIQASVTAPGKSAEDMTLGQVAESVRRGKTDLEHVRFASDPKNAAASARTPAGILADLQDQWGARARAEVEKDLKRQLAAEKNLLGAREQKIRAAAVDSDSWVEHQIDQSLRGRLRALAGDSAFRAGDDLGSAAVPHTHAAIKAMKGEPFLETIKPSASGKGKAANSYALHDRLQDLIEAARTGGGNGKALFDSLPKKHQDVIRHEVGRADTALADWRAAKVKHAADLSAAEARVKVEKDSLDRLQRDLNDKTAAGIPDEDLSRLRSSLTTQSAAVLTAEQEAAGLKIRPPKAKDPFGARVIQHEPPYDATLETHIANDAKDFSTQTARVIAAENKARAAVVETAAEWAEGYAKAGTSMPSRLANSAIGRLGGAARRIGQEMGVITGDIRGAVAGVVGDKPKTFAAKWKSRIKTGADYLLGAPMPDGKRKGGVVGFVADLPNYQKGLMGVGGLASAVGIIGVSKDGVINWHAKGPEEMWNHIRDPKTRPRMVYRYYDVGQNNESVVMILEGRTKDGERVVISGKRIYKDEKKEDETIPSLMPVQAYLDGIRNNGGQKNSAVNLDQDTRDRVTNALKELQKDASKHFTDIKLGEDDEYSWRGRSGGDNVKVMDRGGEKTVQEISNQYVNGLLKGFAGGVPRDKFHGSLGDVFDTPESDILSLHQAREVLMGKDGRRGLLSPNADIQKAWKDGKNGDLFNALKTEFGRMPKADDTQQANLHRIITVFSRGSSAAKLTPEQQNTLRGMIGNSGSSSSGGSANAGASAGASSSGSAGPRYSGPPPWNVSAHQKTHDDLLDSTVDAVLSNLSQSGRSPNRVSVQRAIQAKWELSAQDLQDEAKRDKTIYTPAEFWAAVSERTLGHYFKKASFNPTGLQKVAARAESRDVLAKSASALIGAGQRMLTGEHYDEAKHTRQPKGSGRGGEFAPKHGGQRGSGGAAPPRPGNPRPPAQDQRGFFEPVRLGGAVGGAVGGSAAWEVAARFLPGPLKNAGMLGRLAWQLGAAGLGGVGGQMAGEKAGALTYEARGKRAPGTFMPNRPEGEEISRTLGGLAGSFLGGITRNPVKAIAIGTAGQLSGEEAAAKLYEVTSRRYGPEVATRISRASMPRGHVS